MTFERGWGFVPAVVIALSSFPADAMPLSEALQRAVSTDPALRVIEAQYDAESELGAQLTGTRLPNVALGGGWDFNRTRTSSDFFGSHRETFPSYSVGLTARQPVFRLDWFARGAHARALDRLALATREEREKRYYLGVVERYFLVLAADDQLQFAEAEAEAIREALENTQRRFEAELIPGVDLREAEARDDLAQARLLAAEQGLSDAREALAESVGPLGQMPGLREDAMLPGVEGEEVDAWTRQALEYSPAVRAAREAVAVAEAESLARRSERAPSVDLVGRVERFDNSDSFIGQRSTNALIGLEISVPIYAGGINGAREREASARQRAAEAELLRLTGEVERFTRDLWRGARTAERQARAFEAAARSAEAAQLATENGYQAGNRTIVDVLDARSAVVQARRDLSQARYNQILSVLTLQQVSGVLSFDELLALDDLLTY